MAENKFKLTPEQREVIESKNKNLLISAAAGSGKTMIMIEKIKDIIINQKIPVSNLLVVTFTKAAANEMKNKLFESLEKIEPKNDYIKEQLSEIAIANISTVHSFCARLLKQYFYEIGLDPSFILIDEIESASLKDKSYGKLVDFAYDSRDNNFFELLDIFSQNRKDESFKTNIFMLYEFLKNQIDANVWFEETINASYNTNLINNTAVNYLLEIIRRDAKDLLLEIDETLKKCMAFDNKPLCGFLQSIESNVGEILSCKNSEQLIDCVRILPPLIRRPSTVRGEQEFLYEDAAFVREEYNKLISKINTFFVDENYDKMQSKISLSKTRVELLFEYVKKFEEYYNDYKRERIALDFNDLEHLTLKLLLNEEIKQTIKNKFKYVFVDEYQDTNYVQEEILKNISSENNRFMVGDIKQSIYKFRESEPQIFIDKYNDFKSGSLPFSKSINLRENFRSHQDILAFTNNIFKHVMTTDFGGVDYKNEAMLNKGGEKHPVSKNGDPIVKVNIIIQDSQSKEEKNETLPPYSVKNHEYLDTDDKKKGSVEGKLVAQEIKRLLDGRSIYVPKTKQYSKILTYSDIVILTASRGDHLNGVLSELEAQGIPYSSDIVSDVFEDSAMNLLKCLLMIIDNPKQDVPLLGLMQSELFDFSKTELSAIRINSRDRRFFYQAVEDAKNSTKMSSVIKQKIADMEALLEKFRFYSKYMEVDNLIISILNQTPLECIILKSAEGDKSIQKLQKLLVSINGKSYNTNLSKFIDSLNEGSVMFESISTKNSVKVSTIHKSKGLEYPVVIVVGAGRGLLNDRNFDFKTSRNFGVGINYYDTSLRTKSSTIVKNACKEENQLSSLEEKSRLLYVALTRAMNYLIVVGTDKKSSKNRDVKKPERAKSFLDWIKFAIRDKEEGRLETEESFEVERHSFYELSKLKSEKTDKKLVFSKPNEIIESAIEQKFDYKYPHTELTIKPSKTSVSELMKLDENDTYIKSNVENYSSQAIDKGNAYHKVMQHIDYNLSTQAECQSFVFNMYEDKLLSHSEYALVDATQIYNLISSDKFKGIIKDRRCLREREFIAMPDEKADSDSTIIQGVVDLIAIGDENVILIDYKTNNFKNAQDFTKKYKTQLDIYGDVIERSFGKPILAKYVYSFVLNKFVDM